MTVCAVTGANGFVGQAACRHFTALGWRVIRLVRSPQQTGGEVRRFVLGEPAAADLLAGADVLVHAAYDFSLRSWADICRVNVRGSDMLFDAAKRAGVGRVIFISSLAAFEGCRSYYGLGKLAAEEAARVRGAVVIRPGVIYSEQNGGLAAKIARAAQILPILPMIGSGRYPLYMCHVDDLCRLVVFLAQMDQLPADPVAAAHPSPITLRALAESANRGRSVRIILPIPWPALFLALWCLEKLGVRLGFRSDSVLSLVHANQAVDLSSLDRLPIEFRPYQPARSERPPI